MKSQKFTAIGICLAIFMLGAITVRGADLVGVYPVTNQILLVEFNEGHINYDVFGNENANVVYANTLNTTNAGNKANYTITSPNDGNYSASRQPVNIGRKAKPYEFNRYGGTPPYIQRHSVYLELPYPMVRDRSYKLTLNGLSENTNEYSFVFNEKILLSPTLHVNQVGFVADGVKYAYLSQWMGTFNTATHSNGGLNLNGFSASQFQLIRVSDNAVVFTGGITKQADKTTIELTNGNFSTTPNSTKADVWQCDFSTYNTPGTYKVAVDGIGCSYPFEIGADVYRTPFNYVMRGIFTQRQGVDKEIEGGQVYPRGHTDIKYVGTSTSVNLYGYYYDAGDWDGHNRHIGLPLDLMLLYDMKPGNFRDGDVANRYRLNSTSAWVNEGTDGLPDILNEARWLLDFYKRAKGALSAIGRGTGGVPGGAIPGAEGLIGPDAGCENRASWTDTRTAYVNGEQTENTYNYAAAAAYYAICLRKFYGVSGNTEINSWITEATSAFNWADNRSDDEGTDGCRKAKSVASAAMFRLTGTVSYQDNLKRLIALDGSYPSHDCWQNPWPWQYAAMIYGLTPDGTANLDVAYRTTLRNAIINKANSDEAVGLTRGMRMSFPAGRMGGNGAFSTPRVYFCAFAHQITGDVKYLKTIQNTTSYTLGGNQNNMVYVAQLGHNPDNNTFHPDSWRLLDYNSKVYKSTSLPGQVNYYGMQNCDFFGCGYNWTVDEDFSRSAASPGIDSWPAGEWRMNNKYSIAGSEFTMNEIFGPAAFAYGYLAAPAPAQPYTQNARPTVSLNLSENQDFRKEGCDLKVTASADVWSVKYYYDWHFIGESFDKANNFKFYWVSPLANGTVTDITAVAYDIQGLRSNPSADGDRRVTIRTGAACETEIIPVTGINVTPATATLGFGATTQLSYEVLPANATNKNVTITNSNSAVASINTSNLITAGTSAGTTTITVTTQEGGFSDQCVVTVQSIPPTSYNISPATVSLSIGQTQQLAVAYTPTNANRKGTWQTSDPLVATVSQSGLITAVGSGTALISNSDYPSATCAVTVPVAPTCVTYQAETGFTGSSVVVSTSSAGYTGSGFLDYGGQNSYAEWNVTVPAAGSYIFKLRYGNGSSGNRQCEFRANSTARGNIAFTPTGSWSVWGITEFTSDLNAGSNVVRLIANTSAGGPNLDNFEVCGSSVTVPVEGISLNKSSLSLNLGPCGPGSETLIATISPSNASNQIVHWTTNTPGVATVASNGAVTAVGAGTAVITATSDDDNTIKATCNVTVTATISPTGVTVTPATASILVNGTVQLSHQVLPVCLPQIVTWSSNASSVASVSQTGLVTGVSTGTAVITATSQDGSKSATSTITVGEVPPCTLYQAETGYTGSSVVVATNQVGYTGSGFLDYGGQNSYAEWNISVATAGSYTFKFRYGNGSTGNRQCEFRANGSAKGNVAFAPTGSWATWGFVEFTVALNAGNNIIRLVANTSAGGPNLDNFEVCGGTPPVYYTLNTSASNGSINRNPDAPTYASGTSVTLTATPNSGYTFSGWGGDINGSTNPYILTMNSNKNVTATFTANPNTYTITVDVVGCGTVNLNPIKAAYLSGESVTITATPCSGWVFSHWSGDYTGTSNPILVVVSENITLTAVFVELTTPDCILANPSFESDLQSWTINSGTIAISTSATDGLKSARLYGTNAGMEQGYVHTVATGTTVTVTFDARIAGTVGWAGVGLDFKNASNVDLLKQNVQITNAAWQAKTIVANAPAGTEKLNVWAYTSSGELYVDDFCISGTGLKSAEVTPSFFAVTSLMAYPNPVTHGELNLVLEDRAETSLAKVEMFDITGRVVYMNEISFAGSLSHRVDCSSISKGIYYVHVKTTGLDKTIKIIVQ